MTESNSVTIGQYLKNEREKRGISLKIVSQHTKISATMLQHLEDERFDLLPNKTYVKGFVKSVSKTLGLSESDTLDLLESTLGGDKPVPSTPKTVIKDETDSSLNSEPVFKMGLVALGALLIIGFFIIFNMKKDNGGEDPKVEPVATPVIEKKKEIITPRTLTADSPLKSERAVAPPVEPTPVATPVPTPIPTPTATPVPKATSTPEPGEEEGEEKAEAEQEKIEFRKFSGPLYSFNEENAQAELDKYVPEIYQSSVADGKQNVFITAVEGDTWLTYKVDDEPVKKFVLKKGRHLIIRGDEIIAFLGNVKETRIFLNNKPLVIHSRSGVKSLVFPQEKRDNYHLPLFIYDKRTGDASTSKEFLEKQQQ